MTREPERDTTGEAPVPFGVVVVAHGDLADTLVRLVERILGSRPAAEAVSVGWDDDVAASRRRIQEAIDRADGGRGVLLLTDMFGGTPTNLTLPLLKAGGVEVITGVNLPMMVKVESLRRGEGTLREAADRLREVGQKAIQLATYYLEKPGGPGGAPPSP
jgi:PTS system mannose-specific IIA component